MVLDSTVEVFTLQPPQTRGDDRRGFRGYRVESYAAQELFSSAIKPQFRKSEL